MDEDSKVSLRKQIVNKINREEDRSQQIRQRISEIPSAAGSISGNIESNDTADHLKVFSPVVFSETPDVSTKEE
ncbi:unnamed protein product [Dovyalis caffra]|uniref:Uncharacterized protein n=1 Tax=Dovyalis caffra TaxID=77055 RepID=A0AAV1S6Y8_9ROSI|nr:unnamed protein product [Dovyalis caffra]